MASTSEELKTRTKDDAMVSGPKKNQEINVTVTVTWDTPSCYPSFVHLIMQQVHQVLLGLERCLVRRAVILFQ